MTTAEDALLERWRAEKPYYDLWGRFICDRLTTLLRAKLGDARFQTFLKLPFAPRLKADASFVEKALHRKKYADPFEETEDKVGIRLVVLLEADLRTVEHVISNEDSAWVVIKARDHETEITLSPYEFAYQSVHLILRSKSGITFAGEDLPENMPCEVQIRTLLQHAHSELTHDTIYKPSVVATPEMKRAAAKSMALIEATSDYFTSLSEKIAAATKTDKALAEEIRQIYMASISTDVDTESSPLDQLIIDRYKNELAAGASELRDWLSSRSFVYQLIRERAVNRRSFRLPAILLVYFSVEKSPRGSKIDSPLGDDDLEPVYVDLGKSFKGA